MEAEHTVYTFVQPQITANVIIMKRAVAVTSSSTSILIVNFNSNLEDKFTVYYAIISHILPQTMSCWTTMIIQIFLTRTNNTRSKQTQFSSVEMYLWELPLILTSQNLYH